MSNTQNNMYVGYMSPEHNTLILDIKSLYSDKITNNVDHVNLRINVIDNGDGHTYLCGYNDNKNNHYNAHLYLNGILYPDLEEMSGEKYMTSYVSPYVFVLRINPEDFAEAEMILNVDICTKTTCLSTQSIKICVSDDMQPVGDYSLDGNVLDSKLETHMLIRTNPKLTGNIKLVVDSKYNLYLDTFNVSSILNNRVYRKYPVSSLGNYPFDVMTVFSSLPEGELFKLPADSLNPHKFYNDYKNQYETIYEYGAETNTDNLYTENMKILAPLFLGKTVPDYFCIFRYDGTYNQSSYNDVDIDDTNQFKMLIKDSKVVKIFDLRNYTTIGQYLHNYRNTINEFLYGSCYLQFIEQDTVKYRTDYRQGNNSWRGIDVKRGLITNKVETSYFANEVLSEKSGVQEKFNNYILEGYERNNVLYPYILNIEFMFNDTETEDFSMHRYFGLYLSANDFLKYDSIIKNSDNIIHKYDENDNEVVDQHIFEEIFNSRFDDRIFFMSTNNDVARIQSNKDVKHFINTYVCNNPDKNLCNVKAEKINWHSGEKSFMTLTFTEPIEYGEHLRFILLHHRNDVYKTYENICLEIVASNDERLATTDDNISPYVSTNCPPTFKDNVYDDYSQIYRISFYTQDLSDSSKHATLSEQIARIRAAILKFNSFVRVESSNEDTIGLTADYEEVYFQHIAKLNKYKDIEFNYMFITQNSVGREQTINYISDKSALEFPDMYVSKIHNIFMNNDAAANKTNVAPLKNTDSYVIGNDIYLKKSNKNVSNIAVNNTVCKYAEYKDNTVIDTIRYFSKTEYSYMYPLSSYSYYFSPKYVAFSTFGYDVLGWRYNNIVKFKSISELKNAYAIYDDIESILKVEKHPIVKTVNQTFETIRKIKTESGYVTDNILAQMKKDIMTQELCLSSSEKNSLVNPYNVDYSIVDFDIAPFVHNYQICLFNPEAAAVSVMGMFNIKDIDMSIDVIANDKITNNDTLVIPAGSVLHIDSQSDTRVRKNIVYQIIRGSFNEFPAHKFVIIGDTLYYTMSDDANAEVKMMNLYNDTLVAATDIVIKSNDNSSSQIYDYINEYPTQNVRNFLNGNNLAISVVPQTNCQWESNGIYFDNNNILDVSKLKSYERVGFFTEYKKSPISYLGGNRVVSNSIDSYVKSGNTVMKFRECLERGTMKNVLRKMLIQHSNVDTAVGYYNSYVQSLEFIYYGIKFIINFNSDYYNQNIKVGEYNNFDVFIINEYDVSKNNEIFISVDEEFMLLVNHQYNIYDNKDNYNQLKKIGSGLSESVEYIIRHSPFSIKSDSVCSLDNVTYMYKTNNINSLGKLKKVFIQEDIVSNLVNIATFMPNYYYFSYDGSDSISKERKDIVSVDSNKVACLKVNNNKYSVNNIYAKTDEDLMSATHRQSESYIISYDEETSYNSSAEEINANILQKYMKSIVDKDFTCYVVNEGKVETITMTDNYKPLIMSLSIPNTIKYNFGYFSPHNYNVVEYDTTDNELSEVIDMSLLLSNTKISKVNRLNTYTGNKVFTGNISVQSNYFIIPQKSVLTSNWDMRYYRSYDNRDENKYSYVNGYVPGIEDKSFFGSRCMTLKSDYITLNSFSANDTDVLKRVDSEHNLKAKNIDMYQFNINVTQAINEKFQNDSVFNSNWLGLSDTNNAIKNYIKNSISEIFNVQRQIDVELYKTPTHTDNLEVVYDETDISGWELMNNFKNEISVVNGDIIVTITLEAAKYIKVHPLVKIYRF